MRTAQAVFRIFLMSLVTGFVVGTQTLLLPFYRGRLSYVLPLLWQKSACLIFNIRIRREGRPLKGRQVLYIGNHLSYLDIPAIGSLVMGSFVARGDLAHWPLFGYMGKMQQTIYISRTPQDAARGKAALEARLREGKNLIIFAEGTSSPGTTVLPFKSSLFSLALENPAPQPLAVQPFTISLIEADGRAPGDPAVRDLYAWHGDMTLEPHIWAFAKSRGARILVRFHEPLEAASYQDRKSLCRDCHDAVAGGLVVPEGLAHAA